MLNYNPYNFPTSMLGVPTVGEFSMTDSKELSQIALNSNQIALDSKWILNEVRQSQRVWLYGALGGLVGWSFFEKSRTAGFMSGAAFGGLTAMVWNFVETMNR